MKSETIGKLAEALAKAQGDMQDATKNKSNPFFNSSYADLASVWDACRGPLSVNNLSVTQSLGVGTDGTVLLNTTLLHSSGEWIGSSVPVKPVKLDPQSMGSAITYMRRFALSALVGIAPSEKPTEADSDDDDDGNTASGKAAQKIPDCTFCGGVVIPHKSGKGYICSFWEEGSQHVKFFNHELSKYCKVL